MATLIVLTPPAAGKRLVVQGHRQTVLGRDPTCDLVICKQSISRFHAQIAMLHGEYYLEDLNSMNGTFLNGRKVQQRVALRDGDRITMHDVPIAFFVSDHVESDPQSTILIDNQTSTCSDGLTDFEMSAFPENAGTKLVKGRLETLIEIARDLGSTLDIDEILPRVLDVLFRMFPPAMVGEIHLQAPGQRLVPVAMKHGRGADSTDLTSTPFNRDLLQQALATSQGTIRNEGPRESRSALDEGAQSIMYVPIQGPTLEPFGVILLETDESSYQFTAEDLELLSAVAVLAGQAIGYSRAHQIVEQHTLTVRQLETARQIQFGMLPRSRPQVPGYAFSDYYASADKVGGDYYFYEMLRDGRVIFGLADASGKGLPAALNIARFAGEVRLRIATSSTLKSALSSLNQFVIEGGDECMFITTCVCVLDPQSNMVAVANAGHLPPLMKHRQRGRIEMVTGANRSFPLGISSTFDLHPLSVKLEVGDQLVMFTDGVTEAMREDQALFGTDRLISAVSESKGGIDTLVSDLVASVDQFRNGRNANDDTTILAFERMS